MYVHIIIIIIIIIITLDWQPGSKLLFYQKLNNSSQHKQALYRFLFDAFTFDHRQPQTSVSFGHELATVWTVRAADNARIMYLCIIIPLCCLQWLRN
jgi:hypothetical protein